MPNIITVEKKCIEKKEEQTTISTDRIKNIIIQNGPLSKWPIHTLLTQKAVNIGVCVKSIRIVCCGIIQANIVYIAGGILPSIFRVAFYFYFLYFVLSFSVVIVGNLNAETIHM